MRYIPSPSVPPEPTRVHGPLYDDEVSAQGREIARERERLLARIEHAARFRELTEVRRLATELERNEARLLVTTW